MKIYVIDNYDSFVYNIVHYLKELDAEAITVAKNDAVDMDAIRQYDRIILSPGPGLPKESGRLMEVIDHYHTTHSILGICLGHQAIGEYFGGQLKHLPTPLHGISSAIRILDDNCLFKNIPDHTTVGHYHSWVVETDAANDLRVLALDSHDNIMALRHREYNIFGLQFHPESVLTENGKTILRNWLNI